MNTKLAALAILAVGAVALASIATAGPSQQPRPQRVVITAKSGDVNEFVLRPARAGVVKPDTGTRTACCWTQRFVVHDGQKIEIDDPLVTFTGKRGTFAYRARISWLDAGNGSSIGTGTWKLVDGSGAYAHFKGHGRLAIEWPAPGETTWQAEGYLGPR
jgi:hypothetical protein